MALQTRKPTGKPGWPIILIAGTEKAGKSFAAAVASASPLIRDTYWIGFGEDDPDEYGQIGRFEIVEHDSTYRGAMKAIDDVNAVPVGDLPDLLVFDSATPLWELLKDETQETAWRRAKAIAERRKQHFDKLADEVPVGRDLWNIATQRHAHFITALKEHRGPVIITAKLKEVSGTDSEGKPTKDREWSIQGNSQLPFDVGAIVQLRGYRNAVVTGVRSLKWRATPEEIVPVKDFTVERLWQSMGIEDAADRAASTPDAAKSVDADETESRIVARRAEVLAEIAALAPAKEARNKVAAEWLEAYGHAITVTFDIAALEAVRDSLKVAAA